MTQTNPLLPNETIESDKQTVVNATWGAALLTAAGLAFFGLAISTVNFRDWEDYILVGFPLLLAAVNLASIYLMRRGRVALGTGIVFALNLILPVILSVIVRDTLWPALSYAAISSVLLIWRALPRRSWRWAIIATVAILITVVIIQIIAPPGRFTNPPTLNTFIFVLVSVLLASFIYQAIQEYYGGLANFLQASIRNRLTAIVIGAALVPILLLSVIIGWIGYVQIRDTLTQEALDKLDAVHNIKSGQIASYLAERESDMQTLVEVVHTQRDRAIELLTITNGLKSGELTRLFQTWDADVRDVASDPGVAAGIIVGDYEQQGFFAAYAGIHGFEDIFLIDPAGNVVYSVQKGAVVGNSLLSGAYKDSNLAGLYQNLKGAQAGRAVIADAGLLDGKMSMFIGAPIYAGSTFVGILAYQLPLAQINTIVQNRIGFTAASAEAYLVGKVGIENQLRSDRVVKQGKIGDPKPGADADKALAGESGNDLKTGSTGDSEFTVYQPLDIPGLNWGIVSTISTLDVFAPQIEGQKDYFTTYAETYGYYDILLVDQAGYVFYSVAQENDYQSNLLTGEFSNSSLGGMLAEFSTRNPQDLQYEFVDFARYAPSGGRPAGFLVSPILDANNELELTLVAQVSLNQINEIMNETTGLGETGETYLVGPDKLFRNDSRFIADLGVVTTVMDETHPVDTVASRAALAGETGEQLTEDYRGVSVISAWAPLVIIPPDAVHPQGLTWAIIADIDEKEALAPINQLAGTLGIALGLSVLLIGALAVFLGARFALGLARPVIGLSETAAQIAGGNFDLRAEVVGVDEIGALGTSFNNMTERLGAAFADVRKRAAELATVADVGTATATILQADRLLQEVVDLTKERFNLYHSHIYLLDEAGENLVLASGAGEVGRQMVAEGRSIPLDREQSLVARAAREQKGVIVNDVTQAPDFLPNPLLPDTRSELAVPMIVAGKVIGVFDIQSDQVGRFTESDINIQTTLAAQVSTSIQNVRSFEQSKTQADFEALVNTIGQKIQRSTTVEDTLQIAIRELGSALGATRVKANISARKDGINN